MLNFKDFCKCHDWMTLKEQKNTYKAYIEGCRQGYIDGHDSFYISGTNDSRGKYDYFLSKELYLMDNEEKIS